MTTWVLEHDVFPDADQALAAAVREAGGQVLAWSDEWWATGRWPKHLGEPTVFHGSLANADRIARELPWRPGAFCATDRFACSTWWPAAVDDLVSSSYVVTTAAALVADGPLHEFGDRVFVRPDSPLKPFGGRVLDRDRITLAALDHGFYYDDEELSVVVAPAVEVGAEWRFVVAGARVVAGSGYAPDGRTAGTAITDSHASWHYAADVITRLSPPDPVYILDVCETPAGLRVLELNPFSGADLYNCDRRAVVEAVHELTG